jgi:hypothetical protein
MKTKAGPFHFSKDRKIVEEYTQELQDVVQRALEEEEAVLIAAYSGFHPQ